MRLKSTRLVLISAAAVLSIGASTAAADTYGTRFEAPAFSPGDINGQDGWLKTGTFDAAINANTAPQKALGLGAQSFRISDAVTSGSFDDQTYSQDLVDEAGETAADSGGLSGGVRQTKFDARFKFAASTSAAPTAGTTGVSIAPDRGDGGRMSNIRINDTGTNLEVLVSEVTDNGPGNAAVFTNVPVATLSRTAAHSLRVEINYVDGASNDVLKIYVDGSSTASHTGTTWEQYYRNDPEQAPAGQKIPTTDGLLFREAGTANPTNSGEGILFDDVRIETSGNPTGPQGPPGTDGTNGTNGTNGTSGPTGPPGPTGPTARTGPVGPSCLRAWPVPRPRCRCSRSRCAPSVPRSRSRRS